MAKEYPSKQRRRRPSGRVAMTYYHSSEKETSKTKPSPFDKRRPEAPGKGRKFLFGLVDAAFIVVVVAAFVYAILIRPEPQVYINNNSYHSKAEYQAAATDIFKKLQNRNKISLNEAAIIKHLQAQFPEVAGGEIILPFFSEKPSVHLDISAPAIRLKSQNDLFVINKAGIAVARAGSLPQAAKLPIIEDQSNFDLKSGKQVLSAESVDFINTLLAQSRRAHLPIKSISLPPRAQELDLTTTDQPYFVKIFLGGDALTQMGQLLAARDEFKTSGGPSQYLDVRVPGKAFYK